ncbi:MAG: hypothetical protein ACRDBG_27320 [Waterburya sp.]
MVDDLTGIVGDWALNPRFEPSLRQTSLLLEKVEKIKYYPVVPKGCDPKSILLRPFARCQYSSVKAVLLGDQPYETVYANGLCFDMKQNCPKPKPLQAILKRIEAETGSTRYLNNKISYLEHLPPMGVLMLNRSLTTNKGRNLHAECWKPFMDEIFLDLSRIEDIVIINIGGGAVPHRELFSKVIDTPHPSPTSGSDFINYSEPIFSNLNIRF